MISPALLAALAAASAPPPLSWPAQFVEAVVAILDAEAPKTFLVDMFPDRPENFDIGEYEGAILVHWIGSKYRFPPGVRAVAGARTFTFDVAIIARGISGMNGAPNLIDVVRQILQGRVILGATALAPVEDGLSGRNDQMWRYDITFSGEAPAVGGAWPHPSEAPR